MYKRNGRINLFIVFPEINYHDVVPINTTTNLAWITMYPTCVDLLIPSIITIKEKRKTSEERNETRLFQFWIGRTEAEIILIQRSSLFLWTHRSTSSQWSLCNYVVLRKIKNNILLLEMVVDYVCSRGIVSTPEPTGIVQPDFHAITGNWLSGLRITEGPHPSRRWKGTDHPHGPPLLFRFVPPSFLLAPISNSPQRYCSSSSVTRNPSSSSIHFLARLVSLLFRHLSTSMQLELLNKRFKRWNWRICAPRALVSRNLFLPWFARRNWRGYLVTCLSLEDVGRARVFCSSKGLFRGRWATFPWSKLLGTRQLPRRYRIPALHGEAFRSWPL